MRLIKIKLFCLSTPHKASINVEMQSSLPSSLNFKNCYYLIEYATGEDDDRDCVHELMRLQESSLTPVKLVARFAARIPNE